MTLARPPDASRTRFLVFSKSYLDFFLPLLFEIDLLPELLDFEREDLLLERDDLLLADDFFDPPFFEALFLDALFFFGTFAPFFRASDKPIAIACFLLFTVLPDLPDLSLPRFFSCMALSTFFCATFEYLAI